jgi:hypothetical protein
MFPMRSRLRFPHWVNKRIGVLDPTVPAPMSPLNAPDSPTWPDYQLPVSK